MGAHRGLMRGDAIPLASLTSGYRSCGRDTRGVASLQREETAAPQNRSDRVFWAVKCRGKLRTSGGSSSAGRAPVCGTGCRGFNPRLPPQLDFFPLPFQISCCRSLPARPYLPHLQRNAATAVETAKYFSGSKTGQSYLAQSTNADRTGSAEGLASYQGCRVPMFQQGQWLRPSPAP